MRLHHLWRQLRERMAQDVNHPAVLSNVTEGGGLTPRFAFMAVMSCGIAILGLLQSSAAVVIGAMLISPLMGPIVQLGFSLCVVDFRMMGRSLLALLGGIGLALATAMLIVWLSPLREATGEILARTHPNLFDLLVALLSGLAGGYAVITRKGEAIVGVAIATALMPPLAVVAFGLATGDTAIAGGAFFLFMTNLLAIALSVTLIAKWYGFGTDNVPKHALWQGGVIAATFLLLAFPLGVALRDIGRQAWVANQTRAVVQEYLQEKGGSIERLEVVRRDAGLSVDLVVIVPNYLPHVQQDLAAQLERRLAQSPELRVRQTLEANDNGRRDRADLDGLSLSVNALAQQAAQLRAEANAAILQGVGQHVEDMDAQVQVDDSQLLLSVGVAADEGLDDSALGALRDALSRGVPGWTVIVWNRDALPLDPALIPITANTAAHGTQH
jgi:uncharacterized hydrophobic protein (TIGR00271 family)